MEDFQVPELDVQVFKFDNARALSGGGSDLESGESEED